MFVEQTETLFRRTVELLDETSNMNSDSSILQTKDSNN